MDSIIPKKISVIICNSNTKDILNLCLANLQDIYNPLEVIVVDNDSVDGSKQLVAENFPWVKLIHNENNGLANAFNIGLQNATGEYILYLGSDAFPEKGKTLEGLIAHFETHPKTGAATVKLVTRDGKIDMDCHRGIPTPFTSAFHFIGLDKIFPQSKFFSSYFMTYENLNTVHPIGMTISHFLMLKKSVQDKVGLWDENFFLYGEDVDMCYRIGQSGYNLMYLGNLQAGHWKGASVGRKETADKIITEGFVNVKGKQMSRKELYLFIRACSAEAMKIFYTKHFKDKYPKVLLWAVLTTIDIQLWIRKINWTRFYSKLENARKS